MSKRTASNPALALRSALTGGMPISILRCAIAVGLIVLGVIWMGVYIHWAKAAALYTPGLGVKPHTALPWMADLKNWNYGIGFVLIYAGMVAAANRGTPLGRGRGVVVGMLASFLFGLIYILTYYMAGDQIYNIPVMKDLNQLNLLVGIGFMAVGFAYATKWE